MLDERSAVVGDMRGTGSLHQLGTRDALGQPIVASFLTPVSTISEEMRRALRILKRAQREPWFPDAAAQESANRFLGLKFDCARIFEKTQQNPNAHIEDLVYAQLEGLFHLGITNSVITRFTENEDAAITPGALFEKETLDWKADWKACSGELCQFLTRSFLPIIMRMYEAYAEDRQQGQGSIDPFIKLAGMSGTARDADCPHADSLIEHAAMAISSESERPVRGPALLVPGTYKLSHHPHPEQPNILSFRAVSFDALRCARLAGEGEMLAMRGSEASVFDAPVARPAALEILEAALSNPKAAGELDLAVHLAGEPITEEIDEIRCLFVALQGRNWPTSARHPHAL